MGGDEIMVITEKISLGTHGKTDIIDITDRVADIVDRSRLANGTVTVFVAGSTAGLTTIEYESGLIADFKALWNRIVPETLRYEHNERWGDGNGYSHIRASLIGASLVIPFENRKMVLGTWQQIVLIDFDNRPRSRQIVIQIMGE
jgi:secondary thiamine-phosphate synthase enzyme